MGQELKVAVIGGGYAGMAASVALAECDVPVTVFESSSHLGGRARGVPYHGATLDNGQHLLLGCYLQTLHMIEKVGGAIESDFLRLPMQLHLHGEFSFSASGLPAPFHVLVGLFNAKGLALGDRVKAARFLSKLQRMGFVLPEDMPVAHLLARYGQGADLAAKLWEPLCIAALNTPISKASAQILLNVLRDALGGSQQDSNMLLPRTDLSSLFPLRAANYIGQRRGNVRTSCRVTGLRCVDGGIEVATTQGIGWFSHVICASAPHAAARLLRPIPEVGQLCENIGRLEYQPIYTVYLQYGAGVALPHPMIGLRRRHSQWLFDKGRITGQHGLVVAVISAEGAHQALALDELGQKVVEELSQEFGLPDRPEWVKVIAERRATFCCAPNLQRPLQITPLPGLLLAGDYTRSDYPATLEAAVISGLACADIITSG